jgi:GT2 family glycosyltransferase
MNVINKISIISLTYNNAHLLQKAISSVNSQIIDTKYEVEYLVVDDSSPKFNVQDVEDKLNKIIFKTQLIINPENFGTVKSFNRAIQASSGDIIIPLSADDEFYDEYVVRDIITEFINSQELIITGVRVPIKEDKELNSLPLIKDRHLFQSRVLLLNKISSRGNIISGASTYYHRSVFDKVGFFDENYRLLEDYPFYLKTLANGINIHFLNRNVIKYGTDGLTNNGRVNHLLIADFIKSYRYAISLGVLDFWQIRFVIYSKILNYDEKFSILNLLKYPDQFIIYCILKVKSIIKNKS